VARRGQWPGRVANRPFPAEKGWLISSSIKQRVFHQWRGFRDRNRVRFDVVRGVDFQQKDRPGRQAVHQY
jgi:hypothetical protein